jgi:uncharacterized protein
MHLTRRSLLQQAGGFTLAGTGPVLAQSAQPGPKDVRFFRIATGSLGGVYYPIGSTMALAISNPPGSRPCDKGGSCGVPGLIAAAQSSHGSVANVQAIASGAVDSGFVQADIAYAAHSGTGVFQGKPPLSSLRAIANLYPEHVHVVVRKGASVATIRDLKGRTVSLDEAGSGTLASSRLILEAFGVKESELNAQHIPSDQAVQRMKDGNLDAFFFFAGYPAPAVSELANSVAIDLVPITGEPVKRLQAKYRFFSADIVPVGAYKGVGRTETLTVGAQWLVSANTPETLVHDITAVLWLPLTQQLLDKSHPKGRLIKLESALEGLSVPLHPGAERYYREVGALK